MNNRKITISIIVILVLAVISLGVAFATFSTVLNINGSASVETSSWDIYFTTLASGGTRPSSSTAMPSNTITPTGTVSDATASIVATTFTWSANFKSPGDKVVYTIYVKNGGSYNAKVTSINTPTIQCTTDPKNVCSKLSYGLYTDSAGTTELTTSFTVDAGDTETFYLIAKLADDYGGTSGENLAGSDVTTSQISATVTFGQEGISSSSGGNSGGNSGGSGGGNTPALTTRYLASSTYNSSTGEYEEEWVDEINILSDPTLYIKESNNTKSACFNISSQEYCITKDTYPAELVQFCESIGGDYYEGYGVDYDDEFQCTILNDAYELHVDFRIEEIDPEYNQCEITELAYDPNGFTDIFMVANGSNKNCKIQKSTCNNYVYYTCY